jgi:hypothetical protein
MAKPKIKRNGRTITVRVPISIRKRGGRKVVLAPDGAPSDPSKLFCQRVDNAMVKAIARAFRWRDMLESGMHATIKEIADAELAPANYQRLDALGWVPFDAGGQTAIAPFAAFFRSLGKTVATIFDQQAEAARAAIVAACDAAYEQPYGGFEHLLAAEVSVPMQAWFVRFFVAAGEWPHP